MAINTTILTEGNFSSPYELVLGLNTASGSLFAGCLIISLWVIVFIIANSNKESPKNALIGSSVLALFLTLSGFGFGLIVVGKVLFILVAMASLGLLSGILWKD